MKKTAMITLVLFMAAVSLKAQLLYKISGNGLTAPSYIVGTYHLAPASFADSIPGIRQAMDNCQQVYGEVAIDKMMNADSLAMIQQAMVLPEGMTLDKLLTADEMARLNTFMKGVLGMDMTNPMLAQQMGKMTPGALSTALTVASFIKKSRNLDVQNLIDQYFQKVAFAQGKSVGGLETLAFQKKVLYEGKSLDRQKELLMCQVDHADILEEMVDKITEAYFSQDLKAIKAAMDIKLNSSCDSSPEEEAALIDNRNANWLTKMPGIMAEKPTLFAVGAGHLPGDKGVLNLLRQAGYKVDPVK